MKTIKDVLLDGFWIMPSTPAFVEGGEIPYITSKNIKVGKIDFSNVQYISREDFKTISKNRPIKINDLLISMIGTLGNVAIVKETDGDFYGQNMYLLRLNPEVINLDYFYHFFNSDVIKRYIEGKKNKSTQGYLKANHIEEIIIPVPNLEKQKEISLRFKAINALIDNRKEQLEKLDQLVKSRFIELFGQDVYRHSVNNLADICTVFTDGDWIESKDQSEEGIRLVQTGNIGNGIFKNKEGKMRFVSETTFTELGCKEILPGDILISRLPDPVGRACVVPDSLGKMITAVDCSIVRLKDIIIPQFLVAYTMTEMYQMQIESHVTGSTRKRISRKNLGDVLIPIPSMELQNQFAAFVEQTDKSKLAIQQSVEKLETLKKSLMQKYFG